MNVAVKEDESTEERKESQENERENYFKEDVASKEQGSDFQKKIEETFGKEELNALLKYERERRQRSIQVSVPGSNI